MNYNKSIYNEMKKIIQTTPYLNKNLKSMLLEFIEVKKDYSMMFGNLCILHYKEFTKEYNPEIIKIAAGLELLILSSDIFDDLQDDDSENIWCNTPNLSMNTALSIIFITSKVILESNFNHKLAAREVLDQYTLESIGGQQLDLLNICQDDKSYLEMITKKSGALSTLSCLLGVVLAQGYEDNAVKEYSSLIGVIQQIENDINGLLSSSGKNDLLNKKISLPIIYILSTENKFSKYVSNYYKGDFSSLDIQLVKSELINGGALRYAIAVKNLYKYKSIKLIDDLFISEDAKQYIKYLMN